MSRNERRKKHSYDITSILTELEGKLPQSCLDTWGFEALKAFHDKGTRQFPTASGNWPYDRTRSKDPFVWTISELKDWISGLIFPSSKVRDSIVWDAIRERWRLPANWNRDQIKTFIFEATPPKYTFTGLLEVDHFRDICPLSQMTFNELMGIASGVVTYPGDMNDVKKQLSKNYSISSNLGLSRAIDHYLEGNTQMSNNVEQSLAVLRERVDAFKKNPRHVSDETLAANLTAFYNVVRRVSKLEYAEFAEMWKSSLKYMHDNADIAFGPTRLRRGWNLLELTPGAIGALDGILYMMEHTCDPGKRFINSRSLNLDYALRNINNVTELENFRTFYAVD